MCFVCQNRYGLAMLMVWTTCYSTSCIYLITIVDGTTQSGCFVYPTFALFLFNDKTFKNFILIALFYLFISRSLESSNFIILDNVRILSLHFCRSWTLLLVYSICICIHFLVRIFWEITMISIVSLSGSITLFLVNSS